MQILRDERLKKLREQMKDKTKVQDSFVNGVSYGDDLLMMRYLDDRVEKSFS